MMPFLLRPFTARELLLIKLHHEDLLDCMFEDRRDYTVECGIATHYRRLPSVCGGGVQENLISRFTRHNPPGFELRPAVPLAPL